MNWDVIEGNWKQLKGAAQQKWGELTNDELKTFGNRAVANVPKLQKLMQHVCRNGFEHHVVMTQSHSAAILAEAFSNYFGWEVHHHEPKV